MKKNNCILCASNKKNIFVKQSFDDEYLTLIDPELNKLDRSWVECNDCNLIYHDPQLEESDTIASVSYTHLTLPTNREV